MSGNLSLHNPGLAGGVDAVTGSKVITTGLRDVQGFAATIADATMATGRHLTWTEASNDGNVTVKVWKGGPEAVIVQTANADISATTTVYSFNAPTDRGLTLEEVIYYNATGHISDGTDYYDVEVKNSTTSLAKLTTKTTAIVANTPIVVPLQTTYTVAAAGRIDVVFTKAASAANMPVGLITIRARLTPIADAAAVNVGWVAIGK